MRSIVAIVVACLATPALADVFVTNGAVSPSEGVLNGYLVQTDGETVCANPFVIGRHVSCSNTVREDDNEFVANNFQRVWITDRGTLDAYLVWDDQGDLLCQSPTVWTHFQGPESYLVCE